MPDQILATRRVLTDGEVVVERRGDSAHLRSEGTFAEQPFAFHDLLRVVDDRCVEHWDVAVPAGVAS